MSVETFESACEADEALVKTLIKKGEQALRDLHDENAEYLFYNHLENVDEIDNTSNIKIET